MLTPTDRKRFLTAIQYERFFTHLQISDLDDFDLLQRLAEIASPATLKRALSELTIPETVQLIYHLFRHYREGSYIILSTLKTLYPPTHPLHKLTHGLRSYYYDSQQQIPLDLINMLAFQEVFSRKQTEVCFQLFRKLVNMIIESPVIIAQMLGRDLEQAEQRKQVLQRRFGYAPSLTEFETFTRVFGLYNGLPFFWQGEQQPETSLHDKLQLLNDLFSRPEALSDIPQAEMFSFLSFVLNILLHVETLSQKPEKYDKGLHSLSFAIPTQNKRLEELPALPSLLDGLKAITSSLQQIPLFIYDQSNPQIFSKNQRTIKKLSLEYNCPILHLSLSDILALAKIIGVERLVNTTGTGKLGFGGARNCIFLLTPVLKQLFLKGHHTVDAMLSAKPQLLKDLFQTHVLGNTQNAGDTIFMLDDDMEIPHSNLFCHAFFAQESSQRYTSAAGTSIGRATKFNISYVPLQKFLDDPKIVFASTQWSTQIASAGMSEYITKPMICLNLPFGSEEKHLRGVMEWNPLLHPSLHLAGSRYPTQSLPTRPWHGLEGYLREYIPYSIHIAMTLSLLDPRNQQSRCVLPWNLKEQPTPFTSLKDVCQHIGSPQQQHEMQSRFKQNMNLFQNKSAPDMTFTIAIQDLLSMDVDGVLYDYQEQNKLTTAEKKALANIGQIYSFYQQDAKILEKLTSLVCEGTSVDEARKTLETEYALHLHDLPLTHGLYLLIHSVGLGEFSQLLRIMEQVHG